MRISVLIAILLPMLSIGYAGCIQSGEKIQPAGAVLLVVDGFGASYVYPEYTPYAMDGAPLDKAILFNLTGKGARVLDIRVPVPETVKSHSVMVTGFKDVDPESLGQTIFDIAKSKGYLCLAILQRGDTHEILSRQDAYISFQDNAIQGAAPPTVASQAGFNLSLGIPQLIQRWRDRIGVYTSGQGVAAYTGYDQWGLDAAADVVERLGGKPFILMANVGAVDSAGQSLGYKGYIEAVQALDRPLGRLEEACQRNDVLLVVTADHGMSFSSASAHQGGHEAQKYAVRPESLRIPAVFIGPGVEELNLGGIWSEEDIAPTILEIMGLPGLDSSTGRPMPVVTGWRALTLNQSGSGAEGSKTLSEGQNQLPLPWSRLKMIIGSALILIINLVGAFIIIRIIRNKS